MSQNDLILSHSGLGAESFHVLVFFSGGYHETFYQLFLEEEVASSQAQIGVTMAIGTLSEMVFMLISGKLFTAIRQVST